MTTAVTNMPTKAQINAILSSNPNSQLTTFANDLEQVIMDMQALQNNPNLVNESAFMEEFKTDVYTALKGQTFDPTSLPQNLQDLLTQFNNIMNLPLGPNDVKLSLACSEASITDFQGIFQDLLTNDPDTLSQWTSDFQNLYNNIENYLNTTT